MKIIYLTTAADEYEFLSLNKLWTTGMNPSHQVFHNTFIKTLGETEEVIVISKRPFSRTRCRFRKLQESQRTENNIIWHYLSIPRFKTLRSASCYIDSVRFLKKIDLKDAMIFADLLNPTISFLAKRIASKFKLPVIGIARESPSNIFGTTKRYAQEIFIRSVDYNGYICSTKEINETFNLKNRPSLILEGIVKDLKQADTENIYGRYIFYAGALIEKYGIYTLFKAFKEIKDESLSLLICGQENKSSRFASALHNDQRIKYLGTLPTDTVRQLEKNALVCVNPAPYSEDLSRFCFPQKTLEYLSCSITVTTRNSYLQSIVNDYCFWYDGKTVNSLKEQIEKALNLNEKERDDMITNASQIINSLYSQASARKKIVKFAKQFIK